MIYYKDGINTNDAMVSNAKLLNIPNDFTYVTETHKLLPSVSFEGAKYFTAEDNVTSYPFYLSGMFGIELNTGAPITKVVTSKFKTIEGNTFILQRESNIVKLLIIESSDDAKLSDVIADAHRLSSGVNGLGISSGLCLAKLSVGLFM